MTCVINGNTNGLCPQYTFNEANNQITNSGYTYDAAGDLTSDGANTYQYDAEGRMISVDGGSSGTYVYNGLGLWVGGGGGSMLYNPFGQWIADGDSSGTLSVQLVPGPGNPHMVMYSAYQNNTFFVHPNVLNSSTMGTNASGSVTKDLLFYPWGQFWQTAGTLFEFHYAGFMGVDPPLGLHSALYRQYSSNQGRWMTPDPLGGDITNPQSFNRYAYALNNPETLVDPTGLNAIQYACNFDYCPGVGNFFGGGGLDYLITGEGFYGGENGDVADWYPGNFNPDAGYLSADGGGSFAGGGGGGTSGPSQTGPGGTFRNALSLLLNDGCNVSSTSMDQYIAQAKPSSPLIGQGANFMAAGFKYNLDPRLLVSLAGAESTFGTHITAGQFNALNVLYNQNNPFNSPFASWQSNINAAGRSLTNPYNGYDLTNTSTMYSTYCSGAGCTTGLKNLNTFMQQQGANTNALRNPCNP